MADQYLCPVCSADMTQAVEHALGQSDVRILGLRRAPTLGQPEPTASSVILTCPNGHRARYSLDEPPVLVTDNEDDDFKRLRAVFGPARSLAQLDKFSTWLFATAATVGTLGGGLGVTGLTPLNRDGRHLFAAAVALVGVSLFFAALSKMPLGRHANRNSVDSMDRALGRVLGIRLWLLSLAGLAFGVALLLAGLASAQSNSRGPLPPRLSYTLDKGGKLTATFTVDNAKPGSATMLTAHLGAHRLAPQTQGTADGDGNAAVALSVNTARSVRKVTLVARWRDHAGAQSRTVTITAHPPPAHKHRHHKHRHHHKKR